MCRCGDVGSFASFILKSTSRQVGITSALPEGSRPFGTWAEAVGLWDEGMNPFAGVCRHLRGFVEDSTWDEGINPFARVCRHLRGFVEDSTWDEGMNPFARVCRHLRGFVEDSTSFISKSSNPQILSSSHPLILHPGSPGLILPLSLKKLYLCGQMLRLAYFWAFLSDSFLFFIKKIKIN
jgi:hypothetical protein